MLSEYTTQIIHHFKDLMGINTTILQASKLHCEGKKEHLLASLCESIDATKYISPPGSRIYLESSDLFEQKNIDVSYFEFKYPEYNQLFGSFIPYLSIIDMLFNCGDNTANMIRRASKINE